MSIGFGGVETPEEELEEEEEFHELDEDSGNSNNNNSNKHRTSQDSFQSDIHQKTPNSLTPTSLSTPSPQHLQKSPTSTTTTTIAAETTTSPTQLSPPSTSNINANQINTIITSDNNLSDTKSSSNIDQTPSSVTPATSHESDKDVVEQSKTNPENDLSSELHKLTIQENNCDVDKSDNDRCSKPSETNQDHSAVFCEVQLSEEIVSTELEKALNENDNSDSSKTDVNSNSNVNMKDDGEGCAKQDPSIDHGMKDSDLESKTTCQLNEPNNTNDSSQPKQDSTQAKKNETTSSKPIMGDVESIKTSGDTHGESCLKFDKEPLVGRITPKVADWADMMLSDNKDHADDEQKTADTISAPDDGNSESKDDEKKQLDLDEDVKQPQYIPKKGVFYEHDDRTADSAEKKQPNSIRKQIQQQQHDVNSTENKDSANIIKKPINSERQNENRRGNRRQRSDNDRWDHDRYKYDQQKPKNRSDGNEFSHDNHRPERQSRNQSDRSNRNIIISNSSNNNKSTVGANGSAGDRNQMSNQDGTRNRAGPRGGGDRNQRQNINNDRRTERNGDRNDRKPRRQLSTRNRTDSAGNQNRPRDSQSQRSNRADSKDYNKNNHQQATEQSNKQNIQNQSFNSSSGAASSLRRDVINDGIAKVNTSRTIEGRAKRQGSKDRPVNTVEPVGPSLTIASTSPASVGSDEKKSPPINTVMPPMTTWSNKMGDMVADDVSRATDPSPGRQDRSSSSNKGRSNDAWPVSNPSSNKSSNYNRDQVGPAVSAAVGTSQPSTGPIGPMNQNQSSNHQHYNNSIRSKHRDDGLRQPGQYHNNNRQNNYGDRSNQQQNEWRRSRMNDYEPIKTQTFENSRLSHGINNMNRGPIRDAREILNEKRGIPNTPQHQSFHHHNQQQQSNKMLPSGNLDQQQQHPRTYQPLLNRLGPQHVSPRLHPSGTGLNPYQPHHNNIQPSLHQNLQANHQHNSHQHSHLVHHQPHNQQIQNQQSQHSTSNPHSRLQTNNNPNSNATGSHQAGQPARLAQQQQPQQQATTVISDSTAVQENPTRLNTITSVAGAGSVNSSTTNSGDLINTRPIVKADAYPVTNIANNHVQQQQTMQQQHQHHPQHHHHNQHHQHHHQQSQHPQNTRPVVSGAPLAGQPPGPTTPAAAAAAVAAAHAAATANPHLMGHQHSHLDAQYYPATSTSRDPAGLGPYHGYMPGGHSVIDSTRYHLTSQQHMAEHGYMAASQHVHGDVGAGVQQGMYNDASAAGGTVASSAYLATQVAGSGLSPSTNTPVTGAGGPPSMGPVSYMQHSQYPPPPYTNPYSQQPQQPNQAPPPQSSHAYQYWTYI